MKNYVVALSIFCLALSIVIGSWFISNSLRDSIKGSQPTNSYAHQLLTQTEVAKYLGISIKKVQELTEYFKGDGVYTNILPHVKIDNINYYPKTAIDKWLLSLEGTIAP
jgi:subtilase family serine protease